MQPFIRVNMKRFIGIFEVIGCIQSYILCIVSIILTVLSGLFVNGLSSLSSSDSNIIESFLRGIGVFGSVVGALVFYICLVLSLVTFVLSAICTVCIIKYRSTFRSVYRVVVFGVGFVESAFLVYCGLYVGFLLVCIYFVCLEVVCAYD